MELRKVERYRGYLNCLTLFACSIVFYGFVGVTVDAIAHQKSLHVAYRVGITELRQDSLHIIIDYKNNNIYNYNATENGCSLFPIEADGKSYEFLTARTQLFSEHQLLKTEPLPSETGQIKQTIIFARKARFTKTAVGARLERYGLTFSPGNVDFLVDSDHQQGAKLVRMFKSNRVYYQQYPLLIQIDPLGLMDLLGGVPVKMVKDGEEIDISYSYLNRDTISAILPQACRSLAVQ